ncbi:MAG TPA: thiolase family protein [Acidimicrobiales bacterium]|nr:thiolase family protein [Acidimicrobiales bacterium]
MAPHPFGRVAVVGVHNTEQARRLPGHDSTSIALAGALGALADAGIPASDVDGVVGPGSAEIVLELGLGPCTRRPSALGIPALLDAAALITTGQCDVVLVAAGGAGIHTDSSTTAPWTRPANELVVGYGLFTAAEFALMARRHMIAYGTTPEQMAAVAAIIRTNGHVNPAAVYHGRGPFTAQDILASRMVADPFHLLDCATTSEGGCAIVLARAERAGDSPAPLWILGGASDAFGPAYAVAPAWDLRPRADADLAGRVGARAARRAFAMAGLAPSDVDVAELYDPFSFEVIRQLETFGFCGEGEGGPFVEAGNIAPGGPLPVTTDGGTMSFSHPGINAQQLQRVVRAAEQLRGVCPTNQVAGAEIALCSNGGAGALFCDVVILGRERP